MQEVTEEALKLVQAGFSIVPLLGQKRMSEGTNDPELVRLILEKSSDSSFGIEFGSENNICALKVIPQYGGLESLRNLLKKYGPLPETPQAESLQDTQVYFFKFNPKFYIPTKFSKGIEAQKTGSILPPPSIYVSGTRYLYREGRELGRFPIAQVPEFLVRTGMRRHKG